MYSIYVELCVLAIKNAAKQPSSRIFIPPPFTTHSSDVYAVTRNAEEPALAKMTAIMPNAIDSNDEVMHKDPAFVRPVSDKVQPPPL